MIAGWIAVAAALPAIGWAATFLRFRFRGRAGVAIAIAWTLVALALLLAGPVAQACLGAAWLGLVAWFFALRPGRDRDWAPEVARLPQSTIEGNMLTVRDVRNFRWRSDRDFDEVWETRSFDLRLVEGVDIFNSYWTGPAIAHTLASFCFSDGRHLCVSVEIRKLRGEDFSSLAGFVRAYELAIVAADERDMVGVRTNVRGEDVRLFRLSATPDQARQALVELLARAGRLAREPAFYNSLLRNCTTELFEIARRIEPRLKPDWRILLSGYLPGYLSDAGLLDRCVPLETLRELGRIRERARLGADASDFSARIREGVPRPQIAGVDAPPHSPS